MPDTSELVGLLRATTASLEAVSARLNVLEAKVDEDRGEMREVRILLGQLTKASDRVDMLLIHGNGAEPITAGFRRMNVALSSLQRSLTKVQDSIDEENSQREDFARQIKLKVADRIISGAAAIGVGLLALFK